MFHGIQHIPTGIFLFLGNIDLCTLSCVNRQLDYETRTARVQRKKDFIVGVMRYFHSDSSLIFSLHRTFQEHFEVQIRRLFYLIPEWFEYIDKNDILYLDVSNPYYNCSGNYISRVLRRPIDEVIVEFMTYLSHNKTLTYCNVGMFTKFVSRAQIEQAVQHHPTMSHVELALYSEQVTPSFLAMSLYRVGDVFEWRHHAPQN
jgi:hypothetical protein